MAGTVAPHPSPGSTSALSAMFVTLLTMGNFKTNFDLMWKAILERQWPGQELTLEEIKKSSYFRVSNMLFLWFNGVACAVSKHATLQPANQVQANINFDPSSVPRDERELDSGLPSKGCRTFKKHISGVKLYLFYSFS